MEKCKIGERVVRCSGYSALLSKRPSIICLLSAYCISCICQKLLLTSSQGQYKDFTSACKTIYLCVEIFPAMQWACHNIIYGTLLILLKCSSFFFFLWTSRHAQCQ